MITHFASAKFNLQNAIDLIDAIEETNTSEQVAIRNEYLAQYYACVEGSMRHIQVALDGVNE